MADPAFATAATDVLMTETMDLVEGLLDGRIRPHERRSPFFPFFRTDLWPVALGATAGLALGTVAYLTLAALGRARTDDRGANHRA